MQLRIIKPGLSSTIQDLGREFYRSQAIPVAGAMDRLALRLANKAIGNADNAAVIEFTYAAASFVAEEELLIAYTGGGAFLRVGNEQLPANRPLFIPAGTTVELSYKEQGCRTYLAVAGGWQVPLVLESKSTYLTAKFGGVEGRSLQKGERLKSSPNLTALNQKIFESLGNGYVNYPKWSISSLLSSNSNEIRVVPAQEFTWFEGSSIVDFLSKPFTLTPQSNRMGYHLSGELMKRTNHMEMISTAVTFGTIQVTGNGSLIMLMADGQTTGGYPRIAQVASVDLPLCAQLKPNNTLFFKEISRREAETLYLERERELQQLTAAIALKF